jgi:L-erythro-3,5-diaminohexanoate dehydrogenase
MNADFPSNELCPFGSHRVLEPPGVLPQAAWKVNNQSRCAPNEMLLSVEKLHLDAASLKQMAEQAHGDAAAVAAIIRDTVQQRGKMHNPSTNSGGVLQGHVLEIGDSFRFDQKEKVQVGDSLISLVSLSLTPLRLEQVISVDLKSGHAEVKGTATLFQSGLWAKMPEDVPQEIALGALDVCGAPALAFRWPKPGDVALILGAGRSGLLCAGAARKAGARTIILCDDNPEAVRNAGEAQIADFVFRQDVRDALKMRRMLQDIGPADITFSCVSTPGAEMASILNTKPEGTVCFFSMATSFGAATLGAEGTGSPVTLLMGNGYTPGHAELALNLLRDNKLLYDAFAKCCGGSK